MRAAYELACLLRPRAVLTITGIIASTLHLTPAQAQSSIWNGYAGSSQVQLNFAPATGGEGGGLHFLGAAISDGNNAPPGTIQISQANGNSWTVDTGSEGMVITADYLDKEFGINALSFDKPSTQSIEYTSDGLTYYGFTEDLNVGLYSSDASGKGTLAATSGQMPVFIATSLNNGTSTTSFTGCLPNCTTIGPGSLEQMGVGFGRGYPNAYPRPAGAPLQQDTDPLINLTSVSSGDIATMAPGYVISSTGIELGLTTADLVNTDAEKLLVVPYPGGNGGSSYQEAATTNEWQTPAMTLVVSNAKVSGTYYGSVLVDTGLTNIELATGATQSPGLKYDAADPADSSALQVFLPGAASGAGQPLSYSLLYQGNCPGAENTCPPYQTSSVGLSPIYPDNSHDAPNDGIAIVSSPAPTAAFLNTGGEFLNYFNIVYDPVSGFFGYQLATDPQTSQSNPQLNTGLALQGPVSIPDGTDVTVPVFLFQEFAVSDAPLSNVQLASPGAVTIDSIISSALYCENNLCASTGLEIAAGAFTLTKANDYLGATLVDPGARLNLSGNGGIGDSSGLTDNGAFDIAKTTAGAAAASLSGSGSVALGARTLTLYNANGSFIGAISGSGRLAVTGGVQQLLGASGFTGGTSISGGATVIAGNFSALGSPQSPLNLDNGAVQLQNNLETGPLTVAAGGGAIGSNGYTTLVNGPVSIGGPFWLSGPLLVDAAAQITAGDTAIDGAFFAPALTVASGATLSGTGLIAAPASIAGRLAPGDDPGTLTFADSLTLQPGATSVFDIDGTGTGAGAGNYSRIIVLPPASYTAAGQLQPILRGITGSATNSFTPQLGQAFGIVTAGAVHGSYAGLTQPTGLAPNTRFDVLYSPTAIDLFTTPASYAAFAAVGSQNTASIAQALDAGRPSAGTALTAQQSAIYAPLYPLNAAQLPRALAQLSPQIAADSLIVDRNGWLLANRSIENELQAERGFAADSQSQNTLLAGRKLWFSGLGQTANVNGNAASFHTSLSGFLAGIDAKLLPALTTGLAIGYENTGAGTTTAANLSGDGVQLAAYADYRFGQAFLDGQIGGSLYEANTRQYLSASGIAPAGHNNGNAIGGSISGGYDLTAAAWQFEPSLSLTNARFSQNASTATAGGLGISAAAAAIDSTQSLLSAALQRAFPLGQLALVPDLRLGWNHEYAQDSATVIAGLTGLPGQGFGVASAPIGRNAALLGVGVTLVTRQRLSLFATYTGYISGAGNLQDFSGGVRIAF